MKQKIVGAVHCKLVENFKPHISPLISKSEFEKKYPLFSTSFREKVQQLRIMYDACFGDETLLKDRGIISCSRNKFIESNLIPNNNWDESMDRKEEVFDKLIHEGTNEDKFRSLLIEHKVSISFFTSFFDYCIVNKNYLKTGEEIFDNIVDSLKIDNYGWRKSQPFEEYLELFTRHKFDGYQSEMSVILDLAERYTPVDLPFSTIFVVNVGHSYAGCHTVLNKGFEYRFSKRESFGNTKYFANIFLLNGDTITRIYLGNATCLRFTTFIISKDIQRVDIEKGHIVKFHMHKHFDAEEIVFDSDEDAFKFQQALTERRRRNYSYQRYERQQSFYR